MIVVHLPGTLREYSRVHGEVLLDAGPVREVLLQLQRVYPTLYNSVCDETGAVRRHVNLFINSEMVPVRQPSGLDMSLRHGDVLTIWPAVSGG